jgi:hypothetical protein
MAKNFKDALGSVGPALYEILEAIVQTNDLAASGQIKTFKELVQLSLKAKEAGVDMDFFLTLLSSFRVDRAALAGGEIEMAGAASTGLETQKGNALHVDFNAGGSLVGFELGLNAGYQQSESRANFERSSQNFRILARWQVGPAELAPELMAKMVDFISASTPGAAVPPLPAEFQSPTLEMLRDMLPLLSKVLGVDDTPAGPGQ